ncbi:zinc transporter ZIP6 isoform X2 [Hydra vulgaris]|uniref:Zinc transporter ZIP6 isoform X2 n=1 Tax=Hydra vulgaris TaxID=6087 RepID=A0ABM4CTH7_HYDVU
MNVKHIILILGFVGSSICMPIAEEGSAEEDNKIDLKLKPKSHKEVNGLVAVAPLSLSANVTTTKEVESKFTKSKSVATNNKFSKESNKLHTRCHHHCHCHHEHEHCGHHCCEDHEDHNDECGHDHHHHCDHDDGHDHHEHHHCDCHHDCHGCHQEHCHEEHNPCGHCCDYCCCENEHKK